MERFAKLQSHSYGLAPAHMALPERLARLALVGLFALLYSGGLDFMVLISSTLLYLVYLALVVAAGVCLLADPRAAGRLAVVAPYLAWIVCYCLYGTLVSAYRGLIIGDMLRTLLRNLFVVGALALLLRDRPAAGALARAILLAAIVNCAICVWQTYDASLIATIAFALNSSATAFSENRPAGLWANPNAAAFGFLFALLASRWARGWFAALGRLAAVAGIYLTVSRSGMYLLVLCALVYLAFYRRSIRPSLGQAVLLAGGLALLIALVWVLAYQIDPAALDLGASWNLKRITDFSESSMGTQQDTTRANLTARVLEYALRAPWHGYGIFTFQGSLSYPFTYDIDVGAHNIYLVVLGETGYLGALLYLATLAAGLARLRWLGGTPGDQLVIALMWLCYLLIGLVWHNQFTSVVGMIFAGLLYQLPWLARTAAATARDRGISDGT